MKKRVIALMFVIGLLICASGCSGIQPKEEPIPRVSYMEAMTYPERYDGKKLTVFGILKKEKEGYCLYYSRYAAKYTYPIDGIWLGDLSIAATEEDLNKWNTWNVLVTGLLDEERKGPGNAYSMGMYVTKVESPKTHWDVPWYFWDPYELELEFE